MTGEQGLAFSMMSYALRASKARPNHATMVICD